MENVSVIPPLHKPKYTDFFANFGILISKKRWGYLFSAGGALVSISHCYFSICGPKYTSGCEEILKFAMWFSDLKYLVLDLLHFKIHTMSKNYEIEMSVFQP